MEQLRSEGWQFLELSGRYSGFYTPGTAPTHGNQFIYFCHAVEKIKMHQVEEEYFKLTDSTSQTGQPTIKADGKSESATNPLVHPTPKQSLEEIAKNLPPELLRQIKSMMFLDGDAEEKKKSNGGSATAPSVSVPADMPSSATAQKSLLQSASYAEMP